MEKICGVVLGLAIGLLVCGPVQGAMVTDHLIQYLNAADDSSGTDGWTGSSPAPTDTLGVIGTAPTKVVDGTAQYFHVTGSQQAFGGLVTEKGVSGNFTYELWLRRNGNAFNDNEMQIANWRKWEDFTGNFFSLSIMGTDNGLVDLDYRDRCDTPHRQQHPGVVDIGLSEWHQILFSYQDATGDGNNDGVMTVYEDGAPVTQFSSEPVCMAGGMGADLRLSYLFNLTPSEVYRNFNGDIGIVRMYNKLLSSSEVLQNFNTNAAAYGIPEPATVGILGLGAVLGLRRKK